MSWVLLDHLSEQMKGLSTRSRAILDKADATKRELTPAEATEFDSITNEMREVAARRDEILAEMRQHQEIASAMERAGLPLNVGNDPSRTGHHSARTSQRATEWSREDGRSAVVAPEQRFGDHPVVAEYAQRHAAAEKPITEAHGGLGPYLRALSTTGASAVIPTYWANDIIDRARNAAAVLQAGAQIVPMESKVLQIGRLTGDPTARFRTEGSTITPADPTLDNVTLTATTLSALVVANMEWFQDAENSSSIVADAIGKAIGLELDLVALFGGMTTGAEVGATGLNRTLGSPNPTGGVLASLLASASSSVLGGATNGTVQTTGSYWSEIVQTVTQPTLYNETPNAVVWPAQLAQKYANAYDTTGQPLRRPSVLDGVQTLVSNQIPTNLTQGTATTQMTDVFAGDFTKLLIGQRMGITIQTLTERYAENGQVAFVAHWRGDVALARPRAFSAWRFLKNT